MYSKGTVADVDDRGDFVRVTIVYDGNAGEPQTKTVHTVPRQASSTWLEQSVREKLDELNGQANLKAVVTVGTVVDITPQAPSKDDEDRAAFIAAVRSVQQAQRAATLGIDVDVAPLLAELNRQFKPEFVELL